MKDILRERLFREKVLKFLLANEVRLFRSPTEGMMLIKLTNISLTPNTQLGRRLWSFSAQATEIDTCSSTSLKKYGFEIPPSSYNIIAYGDMVEPSIEANIIVDAPIQEEGTQYYSIISEF